MNKQSKEKEFIKWLIIQIREYGLVNKQQVINSGALVLDVSPVTTARYLNKLTSAYGEFKILRFDYVATKDLPVPSDDMELAISIERLSEIQKEIASKKREGIWAEVKR